jgi:peroxiredoxin
MFCIHTIDWTHAAAECTLCRVTDHNTRTRHSTGDHLPPLEFTTLTHGTFYLPGPALVHLQFRRFAGCPVCNLHLQSFRRGHTRLLEAGIQPVAFFHSTADLMRPYQGDLPFPTVPDPERHWYRYFGVERSLAATLHPKVFGAALAGLVGAKSNPFAGGSDQTGLPADFLVNSGGTILAAHYGDHATDQWSLDEVLNLSRHAIQRQNA